MRIPVLNPSEYVTHIDVNVNYVKGVGYRATVLLHRVEENYVSHIIDFKSRPCCFLIESSRRNQNRYVTARETVRQQLQIKSGPVFDWLVGIAKSDGVQLPEVLVS